MHAFGLTPEGTFTIRTASGDRRKNLETVKRPIGEMPKGALRVTWVFGKVQPGAFRVKTATSESPKGFSTIEEALVELKKRRFTVKTGSSCVRHPSIEARPAPSR
jgi:hypothetical protein